MCKCDPNLRTSFCGKPGCEMPEQPKVEKCKWCGDPAGIYTPKECNDCRQMRRIIERQPIIAEKIIDEYKTIRSTFNDL